MPRLEYSAIRVERAKTDTASTKWYRSSQHFEGMLPSPRRYDTNCRCTGAIINVSKRGSCFDVANSPSPPVTYEILTRFVRTYFKAAVINEADGAQVNTNMSAVRLCSTDTYIIFDIQHSLSCDNSLFIRKIPDL